LYKVDEGLQPVSWFAIHAACAIDAGNRKTGAALQLSRYYWVAEELGW